MLKYKPADPGIEWQLTQVAHAESDSLLASNEFEMEKRQQRSSESPNHYDSDDTYGVPTTGPHTNRRTKTRFNVCCTGERVMKVIMFVAIISLAVDNVSLHISMYELRRIVVESQSSSADTLLNKIQLNLTSELEDH